MKSLQDFSTREEYDKYMQALFTMAAMQGLCAVETKSTEVFGSEDEATNWMADTIAAMSVKIARATLSTLQNEQK